MGLCTSCEIFQDKVDNILCDTDGVKMYIDNILVLRKGSLYQNIYQIRVIFYRLSNAGIKVNSPKFRFRLKVIPYLEYIITRERIKPGPKKLQAIMDLGQPNTTRRAYQ